MTRSLSRYVRAIAPLFLATVAAGCASASPDAGSESSTSSAEPLAIGGAAYGTVIAQADAVVQLGFHASGTPSTGTGYVEYFNSRQEVFSGNVTCYAQTGFHAGFSGVITYASFGGAQNRYFFAEAVDRRGAGASGIRVLVGSTPYDCRALSQVYPGVVTAGSLTVLPPVPVAAGPASTTAQ